MGETLYKCHRLKNLLSETADCSCRRASLLAPMSWHCLAVCLFSLVPVPHLGRKVSLSGWSVLGKSKTAF